MLTTKLGNSAAASRPRIQGGGLTKRIQLNNLTWLMSLSASEQRRGSQHPRLVHQHVGHVWVPHRLMMVRSYQGDRQFLHPNALKHRRNSLWQDGGANASIPTGCLFCRALKNHSGQWVCDGALSNHTVGTEKGGAQAQQHINHKEPLNQPVSWYLRLRGHNYCYKFPTSS